ncbi:hypothetical protein [Nocardia pseudovaccinii]|uniref:hypothetical protein n=1 Tax=Nocardia pseudovaccinii TaxID=189540 RepID=UPI0007A3B601|nr:hypothetical protein [Nocardia pseudovaccinii]
MSHREFYAIANITDLEEAFAGAVEDAQGEYGTHYPTGTIAEATRVVLISSQPMSQTDAITQAEKLLADDDPRVRAIDEPAGAIALCGGEHPRTITFDHETWRATGKYTGDWHDAIAQTAINTQYPGEKVIAVRGSRYQERRHPILNTVLPPRTGEIDVITTGGTEHTGWLFFGRASD